jgi:quinol-cytochrome oxidoreductase complex cytochrome b subunit
MATPTWTNPVIKWIDYRLPIFTFTHHSLIDYPTPKNLSYWWNFGSIAGIILVIMIVTGFFLSTNYTAHVDLAFDSVERIMRDVNYGWLLRYLHANGASMFFLIVYIHMFRGLYYGSYKAPRELLWMLGLVILLLMMATAFTGYVLVWGQMSFWAATVITNLFGAIPLVGDALLTWLWGGFSVDNPTLNRIYSLHFLLPFVIVAVVFLHLWALHTHKSGNPTGVEIKSDKDAIPFHPFYTIKDMFGFSAFLILYFAFVFFAPNALGEPDNYIPANPLVTPAHIVPEWYFLPYYAILRAMPENFIGTLGFLPVIVSAKLAGVITMFLSIVILFFLPWLDTSKVRSAKFRPIYKQVFWLLLIDAIVLGWVGANPAEGHFLIIGRIATAYYFFHFIVLMPLVGWFETPRPLPESISASVTKPAGGAA